MRELTFRGEKQRKNYFEGWYFKSVDQSRDLVIILIPGISNFDEKMAFVQYIIHYRGKTYNDFLRYKIDEFEILEPFALKFPHGFISKDRAELRLDFISIDLSFGEFSPLKSSLFSPSIMGFFEYLKMPCYHDIISMNHEVKGRVLIEGEEIDFFGKGYIEGDRGRQFPEFYLWAQCNHFTKEDSSLFLSVADISTKLFHFLGHIAVFHHGGREYRFASYLGSKIKVTVSSDKSFARLSFRNRGQHLKVELKLKEGNALIAPMKDRMDFKIKEQVKSEIKIDFNAYTDQSSFCASELVNWN